MKSILRIIISALVLIILILGSFLIYLMTGKAPQPEKIEFGVTFSQLFAQQMGLDWQKTYLAILDDLKVRNLRLIAYWPKIEPEKGKYVFDDLDWQVQEAEQRNLEVILAIGRKLPRWPECHIPDWAKNLTELEQQERILLMLEQVVNHYKESQVVKIWQIENEPFLETFGECPDLDRDFLKTEIIAVSRADSCEKRREIMLTSSGELSSWASPAVLADILGTTLYRTVWIDEIGRHFKYPITPVFYYKRAQITKWLTGIEKVMVIELQAEPWGKKMLYETDTEEHFKTMDIDKFREIIAYSRQTGFDQIYLWGVEWWYWLKEKRGIDSFWQEAQTLTNTQ